MKNEGDNPNKYFIYITYEKCLIHNSTTCGCNLKKINEDNSSIITRYISFYKFCSKVIEFDNGSFKIVNSKSKLCLFSLRDMN